MTVPSRTAGCSPRGGLLLPPAEQGATSTRAVPFRSRVPPALAHAVVSHCCRDRSVIAPDRPARARRSIGQLAHQVATFGRCEPRVRRFANNAEAEQSQVFAWISAHTHLRVLP